MQQKTHIQKDKEREAEEGRKRSREKATINIGQVLKSQPMYFGMTLA